MHYKDTKICSKITNNILKVMKTKDIGGYEYNSTGATELFNTYLSSHVFMMIYPWQ